MMIAIQFLSKGLVLVLIAQYVIGIKCPRGICKAVCGGDEVEQGNSCKNEKCCVPICTAKKNPCVDTGGICRPDTCTLDELSSGDIEDCCGEAQCCLGCAATCTEAGGQCKDSCLLCEFQRDDLGCCNGRSCCIPSICEVQKKSEPVSLQCYYPFGELAGDTSMPMEDNYFESLPLTTSDSVPFFGIPHLPGEVLFLGTNGVITFNSGVSGFTPGPFPIDNNIPMIAPYWADTDIRNGGNIWYRQTTDPTLVGFASAEVQTVFPEFPSFSANWMFIATWDDVVSNGDVSANQRNNFQVVMVSDGTFSFVMFFFNKLEWLHETLTEVPAQAGFNAGDGIRSYSLPGSGTPAILDAAFLSNIGAPGRYIFRVDSYDFHFPSAPLDICGVGAK